MILPEERYNFSGKKNKKSRSRIIVSIAFILLIALIAAFFIYKGSKNNKIKIANENEKQSISELWKNQHYETINNECESILSEKPMDSKALIYNGFAYFYRGISQYSLEEKLLLIDKAIINLRRALLVCNNTIRGKIKYILAKCYYQKGKYYSDLAIKYMEESIKEGYNGEDSFEYLGLLNSRIGRYEASIDNYQEALKSNPNDMLYLVLAQSYYQVGEDKKAEEYLYSTLDKTVDFSVEQKARYLLGNILMDKGEYDKAEKEYHIILEKNEKAADAHYFLGEIYEKRGNTIKARYEWRKCLEIDSYHYGAKLKLYG